MKPSDYAKKRDPNLERASNVIRWLFKKDQIIAPMSEKKIKLKMMNTNYLVWRLQWEITKEFMNSITGFGYGCKPQRMDIDKRIYTVDIHPIGSGHLATDYITDKEEL